MPRCKDLLMLEHQLTRRRARLRAGKFKVPDGCTWLVAYRPAGLPEPHAIIGLFVIRGDKRLIQTTELVPERSRCKKKRAGAEVNEARKHVGTGGRVVASAISLAGSVVPDKATGLLQGSIWQDQATTHGAQRGIRFEGLQRYLDRTGSKLGVAIEK